MSTLSFNVGPVPPLPDPLILDACAVLSWLDPDATDDRGRIDEVFAAVDSTSVSIPILTVVETATVLHRKYGQHQEATDLFEDLEKAGLDVIPSREEDFLILGPLLDAENRIRDADLQVGLKVGRLSLGDRVVLAAASSRSAVLVTSDRLLGRVAKAVSVKVFDYRGDPF